MKARDEFQRTLVEQNTTDRSPNLDSYNLHSFKTSEKHPLYITISLKFLYMPKKKPGG
jgi:hypothetical protein